MPDQRLASLARLVTEYSLQIKKGDQVAIFANSVAEPLVVELYRQVIRRGGHPLPLLIVPGVDEIMLKEGADAQLQHVSPVLRQIFEHFDVRISIEAESNTRALSGVDPARQALRSQARRPLIKTMLERSARGEMRWNVCPFPCNALAQEADMSLAEFEDFVFGACLLNDPDPVASWQQVKARQQQLIEWLAGKQEVHLLGPGTDLRVGIAGRPFINCWGDSNLPDGEVFCGPVETAVNGHVRFSFPAIEGGREVEDVRLWFEQGVVVKWSAAKNEAFLTEMLRTDEGARRLGEFAFGTNFGIQRFIKNMLFDEKIGGTVHIALGAGYPESGSTNESAIHWDMLCDLRQGGEVWVDGELFAKDGKYSMWE
jgi:aminopeptidase